jgi:hypothetical protein
LLDKTFATAPAVFAHIPSTSPTRRLADLTNMRNIFLPSVASALLLAQASAHTWIEQMSVIDANGNYTGAPGYPRGYVERGTPGFGDPSMTYLIPANGLPRSRIDATDAACKPQQATPNTNSANYPSLVAQPGNFVAMRYLENGHVTLPGNQVGKPGSGGLVYVYASTQPSSNLKLTDLLNWTTQNDLSQGRLLAVNNFDDGRCFQVNANSPMSVQRQKEFPDPIPDQPGSNQERWCETNIQLPMDVTAGSLAVYWVWQWPTLPNRDPGLPKGKDEIYSTCSDVQITTDSSVVKAATGGQKLILQDTSTDAVPNFKDRAANLTLPADPAFYNPSNNARAASSLSPSSAQPLPSQSSVPSPSVPLSPPAISSLATSPFASIPFASFVPVTHTTTKWVTIYRPATATAAANHKR